MSRTPRESGRRFAVSAVPVMASVALVGCGGGDGDQAAARRDQGTAPSSVVAATRSTPAPTTPVRDTRTNTGGRREGLRSINGGAGVDGGEGFDPKEQLRDLVDVISVGAAMRDLKITWLSGVHFTLPPPSPDAADGIVLFVTIGDDPTKGVTTGHGEGASGSDETAGYSEEIQFAIPPGTTRFPVTLQRRSGLRTVSVTLEDGPMPSITIGGLPANTVEVQYTTDSAAGAELIRANEDCSSSPRPQRPRITGAYADGEPFDALLPDQAAVFCRGKRR